MLDCSFTCALGNITFTTTQHIEVVAAGAKVSLLIDFPGHAWWQIRIVVFMIAGAMSALGAHPLRRAPLLAAQVEIEIAAGDIDRARSAADELTRVLAEDVGLYADGGGKVPALSDVPYPVHMEPNLVVEFYSR